MTHPIIKLLHGKDKLDLQSAADGASGRYKVNDDFAPPTTARQVTYGADASGSRAVTKEPVNINFAFSVHIKASSPQELERAKRELQSFLNRAGGTVPLYLAYRSYDDYDFEPFFGIQGAFARFQIEHGALGPSNTVAQYTANTFVATPVFLTIRPQVVYPPQPSGQATGGIFEDYIGKADGKPRGTVISSATTNKFTNPAFMNSTWNSGWTAVGVVSIENKDPANILFGDTSAMIFNVLGSGSTFVQSINVGNTNTHTISFYVKREDGGAISSSDVLVFYNTATVSTTITSLGDGWYRASGSVTGVASAVDVGADFETSAIAYFVDGFQIEEGILSVFCYGDLLDCTWAGTKNLSTSTRTAARLRYAYADVLNRITNYTMRFVWVPTTAAITGDDYLCEDSGDDLAVWLDSSERYNFATVTGGSIQSAAQTLTPGTPEIIHVTFDGTTAIIYRNGTSIQSGNTGINVSLPTYLYIGSDDTPANRINATIQGFATFQHVMTAAEVLADYGHLRYQAARGERIDPLPWVFTEDGDNIIDSEESSTLHTYGVIGGLMGDDVDVQARLTANLTMTNRGFTVGILPLDQRVFDKDILTSAGTNTLLFVDGTGTADTNANNDVRKVIALATSEVSMLATLLTDTNAPRLEHARSVTGLCVLKESTGNRTNVQIRLAVNRSADIEDASTSLWRTISTYTDGYYAYITPTLPINLMARFLDADPQLGFEIRVRRQAGAATEDLWVSHVLFLIHYTEGGAIGAGGTGTTDTAFIRGNLAHYALSTAQTVIKSQRGMPRPLLMRPGLLNVLQIQGTRDKDHVSQLAWAPTHNMTVTDLVTIPRFDIF